MNVSDYNSEVENGGSEKKESTMKGRNNGGSFRAWMCAAVLAALMPSVAQAYFLFPTEAKEARVVFGGNENAANFVELISTQRVDCTYDVNTNYSGITLNFDDFGSGPVEYVDLSSYTNYAFGIAGDPTQVKIEFVDTSDRRASVFAVGITGSLQTYNVAKSLLQVANPLMNIARIRFINFVVDSTAVTLSGQFTVRVDGGLPFAYQVLPAGSGPVSTLSGQPTASAVGGANTQTVVSTLSSSNVVVTYALGSNDFSGSTILFDDFGTPTNEHQNLSILTNLVMAISGTPQSVKFEIEDIFTNKVVATLADVTNAYQYYSIDLSVIQSRGLDVTQVRFMNLVVDQGLVGAGRETGSFSVVLGGLFYSTNVPLTITGTSTGTPTVMPGKPQVIPVGGANEHTVLVNTNATLIDLSYVVTGGFSGATILFDNYGTTNIESRSLTNFSSLVFGVYGKPGKVKMELLDASAHLFVATLVGVTTNAQYFALDRAIITNDLDHIAAINFVVDSALAGPASLTGVFHVVSGGLDYQVLIPGVDNVGTPTLLPGKPQVITLGGSATNTVVTQLSTTDFSVVYGLNASNFAGGTILFDNFGTPDTNEYQDLSALFPLVVGVTGSTENLGIEIADIFTNQLSAILVDTYTVLPPPPPGQTNPPLTRYFTIPQSHLTAKGVDSTRIRFINFVVDSNKAGANQSGAFGILSGGLKPLPYNVAGGATGVVTVLPPNSTNLRSSVIVVGGANSDSTSVNRPSRDAVQINYNVCTGGYAGATILNDDFGTPANESADYSSFTTLVFKVRSTAAKLNFEFEDATSNRTVGSFTGVTTNWQYFAVSTAQLQQEGVDVSHVRFINFVVDQQAAGANCSGWIDLEIQGLYYEMQIGGAGTGTPTLLPNKPTATQVGGGVTGFVNTNAGLMELFYILNASNFAGAVITFDNYGSTNVEFQNLSGFTNIVFGLYGNPEKVKIEFLDTATNKMNIICTNVISTTRYFSIDTSMITNDLTKIVGINFIVDANLAGTNNLFGALRVITAGLNVPLTYGPSATGTVTQLPGLPEAVSLPGGQGTTAFAQLSTQDFSVAYALNATNFAGGTILFDDFGTAGTNESQNLDGFTHLVFGVTGSAANVGFEIEDIYTNKATAILQGTQTATVNYYAIPKADLAASGVDMTQVRFMSFVVDSNKAGAANLTGAFGIKTAGLRLPPLAVTGTATGTVTQLPGLPEAVSLPGGQGTITFAQLSTQDFSVAYALNATNFAGGTILFDDFGTAGTNESQNLNGFTHLVFGVTGSAASVGFEIEDIYTNKASATLLGTQTATIKYYAIAKSDLADRGVDMTQVRFMSFVIDSNKAGAANLTGSFGIRTAGLRPPALSIVGTATGAVTQLPGLPEAVTLPGGQGTTAFAKLSTQAFSVAYALNATNFAGGTILFDNFGTPDTNESQNLSALTYLVFGATGSPASISFEIEDIFTNKATATLLRSPEAEVRVVFGGNEDANNFVTTVDRAHAIDTYDVTTNYSGITLNFDNFGTLPLEYVDLAGLATHPYGVAGTPGSIKLEYVDTADQKAEVPLNGILSGTTQTYSVARSTIQAANPLINLSRIRFINFVVDAGLAGVGNESGTFSITLDNSLPFHLGLGSAALQYYAIPTAELAVRGVNMSQVRFMSFVVDSNKAGAANLTGAFGVLTSGLKPLPYTIGASATGIVSTLPANSTNRLGVTDETGGANVETVVTRPALNQFSMQYNVCTGGYSGATILHDDFGSTPIETANYSGSTTVVFLIKSTATNINFEFEDATNPQTNKVAGAFTGVTTNWQYYAVSTAALQQKGLDISHVRFINFVVDSTSGGPCSGTLDVQIQGLYFEPTISGSTNGPATIMPGNPVVTNVAGGNGSTVVINTNFSLVEVTYAVSTGFAGGSLLWENFGTTNIESQNLSIFTNIVFGLYGKPASTKIEVQDALGRVMRINCVGITTNLQYYRIDAALFTNDLAHVTAINFVLDAGLAGTGNTTGKLNIVSGGFIHPFYVPAGSGPVSLLPPGPPVVTDRVGSNPGTVVTTTGTNHFFVNYSVASGTAGALIRYDDPGTGPVESGDFSSLGSIVFQIKGNPENMKFEFIDTNNVTVGGFFLFLQTNYQFYAVPSSELTQRGFDLAHVKAITLYEDLESAGLDGASGRFDVVVNGLSFTPNGPTDVLPRADNDSDGLPNEWEEIYGLGTGSSTGDNGPDGDPDGDGMSNRDEYYAGSNPMDGNSFSELTFTRTNGTFYISMDGFNQRRYQLECRTSLVSGTWTAIGSPTQLVENVTLARTETAATNGQRYYRYLVKSIGVTPLVGTAGKPDIRIVFGGNEGAGTVITTNSPTELVMQYNVATGGYSGITFNFDPGFSNESMDMSDYTLVTFALSGTPSRVKYEFEDTSGAKISGSLIGITNSYKSYSIRTSLLASNGLDIAHVRFINFVVDGSLTGPGNEIGTLGVRTYGLTYSIQPPSQGSGSATALPATLPVRVDNLGGANSVGTWVQNGTTNVVMNYTVSSGGYDGFIFRYEDFVEPGAQSGDFVATPAITFGISGSPQSVKVEFIDDAGYRVNTFVNGITGTTGWYTFSTADLEDSGLDIRHIQFINFVVDQALAGAGNFAGSINVVTSGLAP